MYINSFFIDLTYLKYDCTRACGLSTIKVEMSRNSFHLILENIVFLAFMELFFIYKNYEFMYKQLAIVCLHYKVIFIKF